MRSPIPYFYCALCVALGQNGFADFSNVRVVATNLDRPAFVTQAPGESENIYVAEQNNASGTARVWQVDVHTGVKSAFLEVTSPVPYPQFSESGIHGLAFHPDYASNKTLYLSRMWYDGNRFTNRLEEYIVGNNGPQFTRLLMDFDNLSTNRGHGINWIGFDPAANGTGQNNLYVAVGDGGILASEPGYTNVSQDLSQPYGKIMRIDVAGPDAYPNDPSKNFAIPVDNPYINDGDPNTLDEVLHSGFRNPWRGNFDSATGNLLVTDNGNLAPNQREEINFIKTGSSGLDFGWSNREGTEQTNYLSEPGGPQGSSLNPIYQYSVANGIAITGAALYNGPVADLDGRIIATDFLGRIYSGVFDTNTPSSQFNGNNMTDFTEITSQIQAGLDRPLGLLTSISKDLMGNIYITSFGPSGSTDGSGFVFTITSVPEPATLATLLLSCMMGVTQFRRIRELGSAK